MDSVNPLARIKELISQITAADKAYYGEDDPLMSDREYDALVEELRALEAKTGVVFANSPTKKVGGSNKAELTPVTHSKPMLSAKKTKSPEEIASFAAGQDVLFSWKLDGLTLVLRYENGAFRQALTRGENGITGEDVTHTVKSIRGVPKKVSCKDPFEVRGEGVLSWADFKLVNRSGEPSHPRNVAAGAVRSLTPDAGKLSHMDFIAFELILPGDESATKEEQLDFLSLNGFQVVEHLFVPAKAGKKGVRSAIDSFDPGAFSYPADGIIAEYNDVAYGRSLGATAHHENRMIALKWEDETHETVFRGVELATTRSGLISLTAFFDPVTIDGAEIRRADLHSLSNFEKFAFGAGDRIRVYKANMIIPQIAENLTKSGTYRLPRVCPCCGSELEERVSARGARNLFCPNEDCIARNAQKIARFCDKDAMNIAGVTAAVLEKLMAFGFVRSYADLYHLDRHREKIVATPGFGNGFYQKLTDAVESSRRCTLARFLTAVGIPLMGPNNARAIDDYFEGSWDAFEKAAAEEYPFTRVEGVSYTLSRNIHAWYADEKEARLWRPVLEEITFSGAMKKAGREGNPFYGAKIVITGVVNGMNRSDLTELLTMLGADVCDDVSGNTTYLIVGEAPGTKKLSKALSNGVTIVTESHFAKMLGESEIEETNA